MLPPIGPRSELGSDVQIDIIAVEIHVTVYIDLVDPTLSTRNDCLIAKSLIGKSGRFFNFFNYCRVVKL